MGCKNFRLFIWKRGFGNMKQIDLEKLESALLLVERIAEGKNPVDGSPCDEDSVLNNPEIIRSMFFVKETLMAVQDCKGVIGKRASSASKRVFPLESLECYEFTGEKTITKFVEQLNSCIDTEDCQKMKYKTITDWLKENEYLKEIQDPILGKATISTDKGNMVGITHSLETSLSGRSYYRVTYNKEAQAFLVRTIPEMMGAA
jgi:hypothetical protein